MKKATFAAVLLTLAAAASASATTVTFGSQAAFEAALDGSFTLVNLDTAPFNSLSSVASPAADTAFGALGFTFTGFDAGISGGQAFQISTPGRDRLIFFGAGFGGQLTINFATPVNGVGWRSNNGDGGRVIAYSGADLGGSLLETANIGSGAFGGLTSTTGIGSVQITCDFNSDLKCGAYDIQFGTFAAAVPEPASWAMMIAGFGLAGATMRRRARLAIA